MDCLSLQIALFTFSACYCIGYISHSDPTLELTLDFVIFFVGNKTKFLSCWSAHVKQVGWNRLILVLSFEISDFIHFRFLLQKSIHWWAHTSGSLANFDLIEYKQAIYCNLLIFKQKIVKNHFVKIVCSHSTLIIFFKNYLIQ